MRAAATAAASPVVKTTTGADVTREFDCAMYPLVQMLSQAHKDAIRSHYSTTTAVHNELNSTHGNYTVPTFNAFAACY